MSERLGSIPEFQDDGGFERKHELISLARQIVREKAEFIVVRRGNFSKPTRNSGQYTLTALERATSFVPSQSGLTYIALRERITEKGLSTVELLSITAAEHQKQLSHHELINHRPLLTFSSKEILYKSVAAGSMVEAAANYLHTLDESLPLVNAELPRHFPALVDVGSIPAGQVLNMHDPASLAVLLKPRSYES